MYEEFMEIKVLMVQYSESWWLQAAIPVRRILYDDRTSFVSLKVASLLLPLINIVCAFLVRQRHVILRPSICYR